MAMTLAELCELGTAELGAMVLRGELSPSHLWVAMSGAAEYRKAVAKGDVVEQHEGDARLVECMTCPSRQERPSERVRGVVRLWCGQPFEERFNTALPTCGFQRVLLGPNRGGR